MAAPSLLRFRASQRPPTALAPRIRLRPIHPLGPGLGLRRRDASPAPLKMQARTLDPFRSSCAERDDNLHAPYPEPVNHDSSDKAAASGNFHLVDKLLKYIHEARVEMGIRDTPDMFVTEKERLSSYKEKLISSRGAVGVEERVIASIICSRAKEALDLASLVMDIANLRLGTIQFSQHTVDQMVRTYASIFCNAAEDAFCKKFKMETALTFLGALRGMGAIYHILTQDTVAELKDGRFKNSITYHMGKYSQEFDKVLKYLEDATVKINPQEPPWSVTDVLWHGIIETKVYVASLADCLEAALSYLKD